MNQISTYPYDANGNQNTDIFNHSLSFDVNRMISTVGGVPEYYEYQPSGDRAGVQNSVFTGYIYFSGVPISVLSGSNYTDLIYAQGQPIAEVAGTQTAQPSYRATDSLGTLVGIAPSSGSLASPVDYAPFGQLFTGTTTGQFGFANLQWDSTTATWHASARQFSPQQGRWQSPDPFDGSYDWSDPQSLNRYSYVNSRPTGSTDPSGLFVLSPGYTPPTVGTVLGGLAPPVAAAFGLFEAANWIVDILNHSDFHGSLKPRPSANPWDDKFGVPYGGLGSSIGQAIGLPTGGCEFGACGGGGLGFMRGAGPYNPNWSKADKLAYIMRLVSLLNVSGVDNKIISCIITDEEDPAMNPSVVNPRGGGFGAIGLMQVRQGSLNDVNRVYGLNGGPRYRQSDLTNPNSNVFIGSSNIGNHVRYAHGDLWEGIRTSGDGTQAYVNRIKSCAGY